MAESPVPAFSVVIPARFASTRLPGKPLLDIAGKPMVVRAMERAAASSAREVVVATDDQRVVDVVGDAAMLTRADHPTGSDRIMEVADRRSWPDDHVVVNVQGDEPLIPPAVIDQVAGLLTASAPGVATLCEPIDTAKDVFDPNIVKVVVAAGRALYFSRAPMPWWRDGFGNANPADVQLSDAPTDIGWKRHIGIYAYRVGALREFVGWPTSRLERTEMLEQLRLLDHGRTIIVAEAVEAVPGGVDTPEDAERVRRMLGR